MNTSECSTPHEFPRQRIGVEITYRQYLWSFIVVLASIRGAFVYHFDFPPSLLYPLSGALLVVFGLFSFRSMMVPNTGSLVLLKNYIKLNMLFIGFYMLASMIALSFNEYVIAYSFAIFPTIFTLIRYDRKLLDCIVYLITLVTVFGIFLFYNIGVSGGFDAIESANLKLRPGELIYSRIGENLLPAGYQGSHHDSANILVMCGTFFLSKALLASSLNAKALNLVVYVTVLFAALLTGSAANIVILLSVSGLALATYSRSHPYFLALVLCCGLISIFFIWEEVVDYFYFYEKLRDNQFVLKGGGIFNSLNLKSVLASLHAILFGFGYILKVPMTFSEIAFIKNLIQVGVIPFGVFMFICFSPLYYIYRFSVKSKQRYHKLRLLSPLNSTSKFIRAYRAKQSRLIIISMPAFAGIMTMLHYGSLFRVTSIGLFCVLLSIFYKEYLDVERAA